jgi:hypothetical protein
MAVEVSGFYTTALMDLKMIPNTINSISVRRLEKWNERRFE